MVTPGNVITLKRDASCKECGADLLAGSKARYYSNEKIYCESEHTGPSTQKSKVSSSAAPTVSVGVQSDPARMLRLAQLFEDAAYLIRVGLKTVQGKEVPAEQHDLPF